VRKNKTENKTNHEELEKSRFDLLLPTTWQGITVFTKLQFIPFLFIRFLIMTFLPYPE
jgi:hypothetical protein